MKNAFKYLFLLGTTLLSISLLAACSEDEELVKNKEKPDEEEEDEVTIDNETLLVNSFVEDTMSIYYFWNEEMPELGPKEIEDSELYFDSLLKKPDDRWSFITDDYGALINYFAGVQKSTGYSLMPIYLNSTSNQVIAFIEYVHRDTPAEEAGLKRGDMIYKIDGEIIDDQNFSDLLSRDIFEATLGEFNANNEIIEVSKVNIEAIETNLHPVIESTVIDTLGHKIGYLAYSSFVANYDTALVSAFSEFKTAGVTDLVFDLRYNGGGAVSTAALLGDMIVSPGNARNTFIERVFNNFLTNEFKRDPGFSTDDLKIKFEENGFNLGLEKFYVLTTASTASASEMIIYGLEPYMDVIQIGTTTHGKYYASTTFSDQANHNWAIQPIILRSINATNSINYSEGLSPDIELDDYFYLFPYELGDPKELFMAKAISEITGEPFIYEDEMGSLKSANVRFDQSQKLKQKLYPNRSRMWVNPSEIMNIQE
ncbi:S41 family peptidase [Marinilabilia rubra]|uniref:Peptidase S41 n=1 Tax=Marinilabilia rubra TaxID=2162893 RepID=A0A2U2BAZ7_9BACT|nr:S41 family peptidase [Marinilabilia rubra]PWE00245.1 peptidase S41 [Marinilabilia rubra]